MLVKPGVRTPTLSGWLGSGVEETLERSPPQAHLYLDHRDSLSGRSSGAMRHFLVRQRNAALMPLRLRAFAGHDAYKSQPGGN